MSSMRQGEGSVTGSFWESVQMIVRTERFLIECETSSEIMMFFPGSGYVQFMQTNCCGCSLFGPIIIKPNECKYMRHIFELRMKDQIEERSSQLLRNLSSCEKKA